MKSIDSKVTRVCGTARLLKPILCCAIVSISTAHGADTAPIVDAASIDEVSRLYGLSVGEAVERLEAEAVASDTYWTIRLDPPGGYAGAWFDAEFNQLVVASNSPNDRERIESMGARFTSVQWSQAELEHVADSIRKIQLAHSEVKRVGVSARLNKVLVAANEQEIDDVRNLLSSFADYVEVVAYTESPDFSSGAVQGAMAIYNHTWYLNTGLTWPCSVAVSINGGFLTAGHCNDPGDVIRSNARATLGTVQASTFNGSSGGPQDSSWVSTNPGWTPQATIIGYLSGTLNVPAKWSGFGESPIGATVCRYGQGSGGPFCGEVDEKNQSFYLQNYLLTGVTILLGSCSNDGDSGGPHVAAATGQIQGLNIGGSPTGTCPADATYVYVQPLGTAIELWSGRHMLTAHGEAAPTVANFLCPDAGNSGSGQYQCTFGHYNSQGETTVAWTASTGDSGSGPILYGSCIVGTPVDVYLTITNPYGTYVNSAAFTCPNIIP